MEEKTVGFHYGVLAPKLKDQADKQGCVINNVEKFQNMANSISNLYLGRILTDKQTTAAQRKLHNMIVKNTHLKEGNENEPVQSGEQSEQEVKPNY